MYDRELAHAILQQIIDALATIEERFSHVHRVEDLTDTPAGMERLDGLCMLFIAIGEALKNLDKITDRSLLSQYPAVDWRGVMGFRDIIAHHYFDVDAELVFFICEHKLQPLAETVRQMLTKI